MQFPTKILLGLAGGIIAFACQQSSEETEEVDSGVPTTTPPPVPDAGVRVPDQFVDAGPTEPAFLKRRLVIATHVAQPAMQWSGDSYLLAWRHATNSLSSAEFSSNGDILGEIKNFPEEDGSFESLQLYKSADGFVLGWLRYVYGWSLHFLSLDMTGSSASPSVQLTDDTFYGLYDFAWNDRRNEFGAIWETWNDGRWLRFGRLSLQGGRLQEDVSFPQEGMCTIEPSLVYDGNGYGLVWTRCGESGSSTDLIRFSSLSESGQMLTPPLSLNDQENPGYWPEMVWTGSEYGVFWLHKEGAVHFTRVDVSGRVILGSRNLVEGDVRFRSIVWTGTEYGICWRDETRGAPQKLFFGRFTSEGNEIGATQQMDEAQYIDPCQIAWDGSHYGMVWSKEGAAYFTRVRPD